MTRWTRLRAPTDVPATVGSLHPVVDGKLEGSPLRNLTAK